MPALLRVIEDANLSMNILLLLPPLTVLLLLISTALALHSMQRTQIRRPFWALGALLIPLLIAHQALIFTSLSDPNGAVVVSAAFSGALTFLIMTLGLVCALSLMHMVDRAQRRRSELARLVHLSQDLLSATTDEQVLQKAVVAAQDLLESDFSSIALLDADGEHFTVRSGAGWPSSVTSAPKLEPCARSQVGYTVAQKRPIAVSDYRQAMPFSVKPQWLQQGIRSGLSAPMLLEDQVLGAISVYARRVRRYSEDDMRRLSLIANQTAVALDKVRLLAETRQRAEALARLNDITQAAIQQQDFDELIQTLADRLGELIGADGCYIILWDAAKQRSKPATARGAVAERFRSLRLDAGQSSLTERILQQARTLVIGDAWHDPVADPELAKQFGVRSLLGLPLIANELKLGAALLTFNQPHRFTPDEVAIGEQAARQIALVMSKAYLFEESRRQTQELTGLYNTALATSSALEMDILLDRFYEQVQQLLAPETFVVALYEPDSNELEITHVMEEGQRLPRFRMPIHEGGLTSWVLSHRRSLLLRDLQIDPTPVKMKHITAPARSWLGVPLIAREQLIGVVSIQSFRPAAFDESDQRFLEALSAQVATALENARLFEAMRRNREEFKIAGEILHSLNATADVAEAFPSIVAGLQAISHCERVSLALLDESRQWATLVMLDQPRAELGQGTRIPIASTAAAADVLAGQLHLTPDLSREIDYPAERVLYEAGYRSRLNLPLRVQEQIIGALNLVWRAVAGYRSEQLPLLSQMADALALAVEKSRLLHEARHRDAILGVLADASAKLLQPGDQNSMLDDILCNLGSAARVSRAYIFENLRGDNDDVLTIQRSEWVAPGQVPRADKLLAQPRSYVADGFERWINVLSGGSALHGLVRHFPESERLLLEAQKVRSIVVVPIFVNSEWWGFLGFDDCEHERVWSGAELEALKSVASALGAALARQRLEQAEREHQALMEALHSSAAALNSTLNFEEVLERILTAVGMVLAHDAANILLIEHGIARVVRCRGYAERGIEELILALRLPVQNIPNLRYMAETGKPFAVPDSARYEGWVSVPATAWVRSLASAPIMVKGQAFGFLNLDSSTPNFYSQKDAERLGAFADQAAIAIENARLFSAEQRGREAAAALLEITQLATSSLKFNVVLRHIAQRTAQVCRAHRCTIHLIDQPGNILRPVMSQFADGHVDHELWSALQAIAVGPIDAIPLFHTAICERRPVLLDDPNDMHLVPAHWTRPFGIQKLLIIPLFSHDQAVGLMALDDIEPERTFTDDQINLALTIAGQVTGIIVNAKLYAQAEHRARQLETLQQAAKQLTMHLDQDILFNQALTILKQDFGCTGALFLLDRATGELVWTAGSMSPGPQLSKNQRRVNWGDGLIGRAAATGAPVLINDSKTAQLEIDDPSFPAHSALAVPLESGGELIGVLYTYREQLFAYEQEDVNVLQTLADQIAIALTNAWLYEEVKQLAITDGLTGLPNHRRFFELATREFERARRYERPLAAIMLDIDHFKQLNDTYGHQVGNQVLRALAERFRTPAILEHGEHRASAEYASGALRDIDIIGRFGGEEFAVVLPESDLRGARAVAERMRLSMEQHPIQTQRGPLRVTISLGVAEMDGNCPDFATLLDRADAAMYAARANGRRNVVGG